MKLLITFLMLIPTLALAGELSCKYERWTPKKGTQSHSFLLSSTQAEAQDNFRTHGYSVKVDGDALDISVNEKEETQENSVKVSSIWSAERFPKMPTAQFTFGKVQVRVICR